MGISPCPAALAVVQAAHAAVGCQVTYAVTAQWPGGFTGNITIRNIGDALTSWTLRWSFTAGQTVTQGWGGNFTHSGAQVTVTNAGWNGNLPTGGSATAGFNGSAPSTSPMTPGSRPSPTPASIASPPTS